MIVSAPLMRSVGEVGQWLVGRRERVRVVGESMQPTLERGEFVLVDPSAQPRLGDLVTAVHPEDDSITVVKRVAARDNDGACYLTSDNPVGTDSRHWGPVPARRIRGRVTVVLDRPLANLGATSPETPMSPPNWIRWLRR